MIRTTFHMVVKTMRSLIRYCWVLPASCIGFVIIPFVVVSGGTVRIAEGVVEAEGGILRFLLSCLGPRSAIDAITIGHVVLGQSWESLVRCRNHERVHVRQYERWGPLFLPLYLMLSAAAFVRGMDPYRDNSFEEEAFRLSGAGGDAANAVQ